MSVSSFYSNLESNADSPSIATKTANSNANINTYVDKRSRLPRKKKRRHLLTRRKRHRARSNDMCDSCEPGTSISESFGALPGLALNLSLDPCDQRSFSESPAEIPDERTGHLCVPEEESRPLIHVADIFESPKCVEQEALRLDLNDPFPMSFSPCQPELVSLVHLDSLNR